MTFYLGHTSASIGFLWPLRNINLSPTSTRNRRPSGLTLSILSNGRKKICTLYLVTIFSHLLDSRSGFLAIVLFPLKFSNPIKWSLTQEITLFLKVVQLRLFFQRVFSFNFFLKVVQFWLFFKRSFRLDIFLKDCITSSKSLPPSKFELKVKYFWLTYF